jgi:hypothetical protein
MIRYDYFFQCFTKKGERKGTTSLSCLLSLPLERKMPPRIVAQPLAGSAEVVASGDALRAVRLEREKRIAFFPESSRQTLQHPLALLLLLNTLSPLFSPFTTQPKSQQAQRLLGYASLEDALAADRRRAETAGGTSASSRGGLSLPSAAAAASEQQQPRVPGLGLGASYLPHSVASRVSGGSSGLSNLERRLGAKIRGREGGGAGSDGDGEEGREATRLRRQGFFRGTRAAAASSSDDEDEGGRAAAIEDKKAFLRATPAVAAAVTTSPEGGGGKKKKKKQDTAENK